MDGAADRDSVKKNIDLLVPAIQALGYRVGVKTCQVHVAACYETMKIPCPGVLAQLITSKLYYLVLKVLGS